MTLAEFRKKTKHMDGSIQLLAQDANRETILVYNVFEGKGNGLQILTPREIEEEKAEGGYVDDYTTDVCLLIVGE